MKLLFHEQKDLMLALKNVGADEHFHFVKKKGWVQINHPTNGQNEFSFHRKKSTLLMEGRFVDTLTYFVKTKGQHVEFTDWPSVYQKFRAWLNE